MVSPELFKNSASPNRLRIFEMNGESYRFRESMKSKRSRISG